jgi:hypothetical protein
MRNDGFEKGFVVVFDEYFDKSVRSVRTKVFDTIQSLCDDTAVQLVPIIITHSKTVKEDCGKGNFIVMNNGQIYDTQRDYKKLLLPRDLVMI